MPFLLMDEDGRQVPLGERGEVWMLGPCVSQGYLDDPGQTSRVYTKVEGQRAFRTGDAAYCDEQGNLFIIGRMGAMVKIAGYRVDLGDVEAALSSVPGVHLAAAFTIRNSAEIDELWACFEWTGSLPPDIFAIKTNLRSRVPAYMVPKRLIVVPHLPLNQNGKVDRKAAAQMAALK